MYYAIAELKSRNKIRTIGLDLLALAVVFLAPTFSHLLGFPLYYLDPMRIIVLAAVVHSHRINAYSLAIVLPLFSFLVSGHPVFPKFILVSFELMFNLLMFQLILSETKKAFLAAFLSVVASKVVYYFFKYLLISAALIESDLISTPLYFQAIVAIIISVYIYFIISKKSKTNSHTNQEEL